MSGASEATLQELLQVNQQMAAAIAKLAGASGGGGAGGGAGGAGPAGALGKAFNAAGAAVGVTAGVLGKAFTPAIWAAKTAFDALGKTGAALINNQMRLADGAIAGTNALSDMTAGLEKLPFGLGLVAQAMTYQTKILETNLKTYQQISDVGARFGGSLNETRNAAKGMGLSMDEFAETMKKNGPIFKLIGANSEEGAKNLRNFNTQLIRGDAGRQIMNLGYSLKETNDLLGAYAEITGGISSAEMKDQKRMEQSVTAFANELDLAAQLEGVSRQEKEKQMKEAANNAAIQAKLATMTQDQRDKYEKSLSRALMIGGKGGADALNSALLGLPPMTKEAQNFAAIMPDAAASVNNLADTVQDSTTLAEAQNKIDKETVKGQQASAEAVKALGPAASAMAFKAGGIADTINAANKNAAVASKQGLDTEEKRLANLKKVEAEQEKVRKTGEAGKIAQQQADAKYAGFMDQLTKLLEPLFPIITGILKGFNELVPKILGFAGQIVENVIKPVFKGLFGNISLGDITRPFKEFFDGLFGGGKGLDFKAISTGIIDFFKPMIDLFGTVIKQFDFRKLGQDLGTTMGNLWKSVSEIFGPIIKRAGEIFGTMAKDFGPVMEDLFSIVNSIIDIIRTVLWPIIKPVVEGFMNAMLPLWEAFKSIIGVIKNLLKGDFSQAGKLIGDAIGNLWSAFKELLSGIWEGIKSLASMGWEALKSAVGFGSEKKPEAKPVDTKPTTSTTPASPNTPASNTGPNASNLPPMTPEAKKMAEENAKKNAPPVTANNTGNVPVVQPKSNDPIEILRAEIQTLNNITTEMLKAMRDTRDYSKSTANTLASNGNLFKRA
jgi:hypothetical protein